jgi:putative lipoprotein
MNKIIMLLATGLLIAACGDPEPQTPEPQPKSETVSGTVIFRERIGLTPESRLEVELQDVSLSDVPAAVIAATAIDNPGQSPISFTIDYIADQIDDRHSYSISARVLDRGHLIMVSDSISPALTRNAPDEVTVYAVRVSQSKQSQPDAGIVGTQWILSTVNGTQVSRREQGPDVQLTLDAGTVSGFGGCNRFKGSYEHTGNKLTIGNLAVTMMACESGGDLETAFLSALGKLHEVRVAGRTLLGYDQGGALIVSFAADPVR